MGKLSEIEKLISDLRQEHLIVDGDCWYSCPKSWKCCNEEKDINLCECGADRHNEKIDQVLALLRAAEREFEEIVAEKKQRDIVIENLKENLRNLDKENEEMREEKADLKNRMEAIEKEIKSLIVKNKKAIELAKQQLANRPKQP